MTVTYCGKTWECTKAVQGADYVRLYDALGEEIVSFNMVSDMSLFELEDGEWSDPIGGGSVIATNAELSNGTIVLTVEDETPIGTFVTFEAPCPCSDALGGITIGDTTYTVLDALGKVATGQAGAWDSGVMVTVMLGDGLAYVQNAASEGYSVNRTLTASGWIGSTAPFTQTVTIANLPASANGYAGVAHTATLAQRNEASKSGVRVTGQAQGTITISADIKKPTINIPITITILH